MSRPLLLACAFLVGTAYPSGAAAQDAPRYRQFPLGASLASIAKLVSGNVSDAKTVHLRPAVIKEWTWRPQMQSGAASTDPVDVMLFRFYDDRLFMIVVDYERRRTEGMSAEDMIAAVSTTHGVRQPPAAPTATPSPVYPISPLAVWGDEQHSVTLLKSTYPQIYTLVVAHTALHALARKAEAEAAGMDAAEAPQRELDRQKDAAERADAAREKAKADNKAAFKP